jgi:hypothetical protein
LFDHFAMKVAIMPRPLGDDFMMVLNSAPRSADSSALSKVMAAFEHAGAGLGVQALDRHPHLLAGVENLVIELGPDGVADRRIAEPARRHRLSGPL